MKKLLTLFASMALTALAACGGDDEPHDSNLEPPKDPVESVSGFARGADISWYTEMEADGRRFYNNKGEERTCPALMKELGMNAVRLRVWVNPENAACHFCNAADVVKKAVAAQEQGLDVMIDFHYSDLWADPSRQETPKAWKDASLDELKDLVAEHTRSVLQQVVQAGVTPKWVQVGNETRNGMLHPTGQLWDNNGGGNLPDGWKHFTALYMAGYNAAKAVCPTALVMPHLNTASKVADNNWWLDEFRKAGGKMDALALSHYPQADGTATTPEAVNKQALLYIKQAAKAYGVPVIVSEFGVKTQADVTTATRLASDFMAGCKEMGTDVCAGVFYWEPEVWGQWRPASYTSYFDNWSAYDMGAFDAAGRPTSVLNSWAQ